MKAVNKQNDKIELSEFRKYILKTDPHHYDGAIKRDEKFKIIQVGKYKVGESACYTTPVRRECNLILRFELPYAVFSSGRVEISHLE